MTGSHGSHAIGEVATMLGIAPSTLRYYEAEGLLPTVGRTTSGRRRFADRDLEACRVIECLKRSGLSIKEIKDFMGMVAEGDATLTDRLALFEGRRAAVERQLEELRLVRAVLDYKTWYYQQAVAAGTEDAVRSATVADIPPEHRAAQAHLAGNAG